MTPLTPCNYRGVEAYLAAYIADDYNLLFASIIGSDSCARAIAAAIVEKPTNDVEYHCPRRQYDVSMQPRQSGSKYHMDIMKLADNAVNATVYHEAFNPAHQNADQIIYLLRHVTDITDRPALREASHNAVWNFLETLNTPLLPQWKEEVCIELASRTDNGNSAWIAGLIAKYGPFICVQLHAPEHKLDNLLTDLIHSGKITF